MHERRALRAAPVRVASTLTRGLRNALLALGCGMAASCAQPAPLDPLERELYAKALDRWLERVVQLETIHERMRLAGAPVCADDLSPVLGLVVTRARELPDPLRRIGAERFGADAPPVVVAVVEGLPAAAADIRVGDRVLRVGARQTLSTRSIYAPPTTRAPEFEVRLTRGERTLTARVENRSGCAYRAELLDSDGMNAYAVERRTVLLAGMLRLLRNDSAVAFVMGHELAHHIQPSASGLRAGSRAAEVRADYLGAYLAERAGYRLSADDFAVVRAAYAASGRLGDSAATHPAYPERAVRFAQTRAEIAHKRASGEPLLPSAEP